MTKPWKQLDAFQPVEIKRGDDVDMQWVFVKTVNGVRSARDVSTWTFTAKVRYPDDLSAEVASWSVDASNAANGVVTISLTDTQTAAFPIQVLRWDLQRVVGGKTRTLVGGPFTVKPDATF